MTPYDYAAAYVSALAGDPATTTLDFRALHDTNKADPGHARRGTLPEWWEWLTAMNQQGYGIFVAVNALDGHGRKLENVESIRAHVIDLDNLSAVQNYERAAAWQPAPCFAVSTSPNKMHVYWPVSPQYRDNQRYETVQRKLRQLFDSDKAVIDPTRVMRLPGTYNVKQPDAPVLVTCHALPGYLQPTNVETLEAALAHVNVIDGGAGERRDLGDPELAAPSLDWIRYGLTLLDPNDLSRDEWIAITAAVKQSGWTLADEPTLFALWSEWCARYADNDPGENHKQWHSIRNTELGWPSLVRRVPALRAAVSFGNAGAAAQPVAGPSIEEVTAPPPLDCSGEYLTHLEQQEWFKGCTFVVALGKMLTPDGRLLNANQFNGKYGGKKFIIDGEGKTTNEAWAAALRSTLWQVPKVDHLRFLPHAEHGAVVQDNLGRTGVNTYKPAIIRRVEGDVSPFLRHIEALLPVESDRKILLDFLAHNVRFPGYKIPWAPVIQSVEGAGKGVIKALVTHAFGVQYVHFPNAKELTSSGSQFNAWVRNKLFILADEIKVDDKRDLIEVLKPLISEVLIEVQSKGVDQELEDNYANWMAFSNYKDAIPVSKNGRRYAIFYSPIQTVADLHARGMDDAYFNALYGWLHADGAAIITDWLMRYPIERGAIPMRAPLTSSHDEAVKVSRTPVERVLIEAMEDQLPGFRGGWISLTSAIKRIKDQGAVRGNIPPHVVTGVLESIGYVAVGRAPRAFFQESNGDNQRSELYHFGGWADPVGFGAMQGWE